MNNPLVSVIIPVYNRAEVLKRSVGSALNQRDINVEVIVTDDGSSDDSIAVLEDMAQQYPTNSLIILKHTKNQGQAIARNTGMARAIGKYIAFLDSDDAFESEHTLSKWISVAEKGGAEVLVARSMQHLANGAISASPVWPISNEPRALSETPILVAAQNCWQCLYLRAFLDTNSIAFSTRLRQREDRLFMLQSFYAADHILFTNQITHVKHRDQENSTMRDRSVDQFEMFVQHIHELTETIHRMRAKKRSNIDFEMANAFQYYRSCTRYWQKAILRCYRDDRRDLVLRLAEGLSLLTEGLPFFGKDERFDRADSARYDLIRVVLQQRKLWVVKQLLKHKNLDRDQLASFAETHSEIVDRYIQVSN